MLFCSSCKNHMKIIERSENGTRKIIYECKKCSIIQECTKTKFMIKTYNRKEFLDTKFNKTKVNDNTLPTKKIKCPHCSKKNTNPYEIKYINNYYCINVICKECYESWLY